MTARAIVAAILMLSASAEASMFGDPSVIAIWQARGWANNSRAVDRVGGAVGTNGTPAVWRSEHWTLGKNAGMQIKLGTAAYLKPSGSWSFATAYMPTNFGTANGDILFNNQGASPFRGISFVASADNRLDVQFYNGSFRNPRSAAGVLSNSTGTLWYNIAVVCNQTNVSGWVNGAQVLSTNISAAIQYDGTETSIGFGYINNAPEGLISYVALWSRALTATEIGIQAAAGPYPIGRVP